MKLLAKVGTLALVAAAAMGTVVGCSSSLDTKQSAGGKGNEGPSGTVGLSLQPVAGITINTIHYTVTNAAGATVLSGDLPTPGTASTFSFGLPLPVGAGYNISLSGSAAESATTTCVGAFGPFAVTANTSTDLTMVLTCTDAANGSINGGVTVKTDSCPRLIVDYVVATPSSANAPGGTIAVASAAHDLDGRAVTYAWTISDTTVGTFAPANASSSTFTCANPGANLVATLTANNGQCSKPLTTHVSCASVTCGNGKLDPGEQCDPTIPAGQAGFGPCPANCHFTCGNGIVEPPAEQCDPVPKDLANCTSTCQVQAKVCGDGLLTSGEQCDTGVTGGAAIFPPGTPTTATCANVAGVCTISLNQPAVCGNGIVEAGEICDPGLLAENCGADCKPITSATCTTCENTLTKFGTAKCPAVACNVLAGSSVAAGPAIGATCVASKCSVTVAGVTSTFASCKTNADCVAMPTLCEETLDCVRDSGCGNGGASLLNCYCGTQDPAACAAVGGGNGPCKAQMQRSLETTDLNTVQQRIGDATFAGGQALGRVFCDQGSCATQCF